MKIQKIKCLFGFHAMIKVWEGMIDVIIKKNAPVIQLKGYWNIYECKNCKYQKASQIKNV